MENFLRGRTGLHARVVILTVIPEEYQAIMDQHPDMQSNKIASYPYRFRKDLGDSTYDVVVTCIRRKGNTSCSTYVQKLVEHFRPEFLILSGIAGGLAASWGADPGNVIVANHVEGYEQQKRTESGFFREREPLDQPSYFLMERVVSEVMDAGTWHQRIKAERPTVGEPDAICGNLISGEKLLGDEKCDIQRDILREFNHAKAVDMESYGLAKVAYELRERRNYSFHYLVVRGVSDVVASADDRESEPSEDELEQMRNQEMRDKWRNYAASSAAAFTFEVVDQIFAVTDDDADIGT